MSAKQGDGDDLEVVVTRTFDAPRPLVFDVWTKRVHLARWFVPDGATMNVIAFEARPGGPVHFCHELANGTKVWVKGAFDEVRAPDRIVFTTGFVDAAGNAAAHPMEPDWPLTARAQTIVLLAEEGDGTRVTVCQRIMPPDVGAHPSVQRERKHARGGWEQILAQLAAHLADKEVRASWQRSVTSA